VEPDSFLLEPSASPETARSPLPPGNVALLLAGQMSPDYIRAMPTINLTNDELAAVAAALRRLIQDDRYPHAPRLDPQCAALRKFDAASEPTPVPKAPPPAKADKRARR
jgi:hypothetical protein